MFTGSYWPGDLYVFRGKADGTFAAGEILKDADGSNLSAGPKWKGEQEPEMDALAAVPFPVDHDGDGDLDLLVGNIAGRVILIPNEGTPTKASFVGSKRAPVVAGGTPIEVPGGDSGPTVADWDGDGKADLVVGAGDGSVLWYRNTGTAKAPKYEAGVALLGPSKGGYAAPFEHGAAPSGPGSRTKVHATDWNGDGRLDLLVGDLWYEKAEEPKLSPEEKAKRDQLRKRRDQMNAEFSELFEKLGNGYEKDPRAIALQEEMSQVYEALSKVDPNPTPHGSVWLHLRRPAASPAK